MKTSVLLHTLFILQQLISNIDLTDNIFEKELGDRAEPDYGKRFQNIKLGFNGEYITLRIAYKNAQNHSSLTAIV